MTGTPVTLPFDRPGGLDGPAAACRRRCAAGTSASIVLSAEAGVLGGLSVLSLNPRICSISHIRDSTEAGGRGAGTETRPVVGEQQAGPAGNAQTGKAEDGLRDLLRATGRTSRIDEGAHGFWRSGRAGGRGRRRPRHLPRPS